MVWARGHIDMNLKLGCVRLRLCWAVTICYFYNVNIFLYFMQIISIKLWFIFILM